MQNRKKILIVEDEAIVAMEIEFLLQSTGYSVVGKATNSNKAIDLAIKFLPDIILMDVNIKGNCNGIEASQEILKFSKPVIIFVTAYNDAETKLKLEIIKPHFFLPKPFSPEDLRKVICVAVSTN
ncbi:MAG: response regulator [Melioribacteraceae bacterium]|nr:response regulator [Melioribacteraceae bacterium]